MQLLEFMKAENPYRFQIIPITFIEKSLEHWDCYHRLRWKSLDGNAWIIALSDNHLLEEFDLVPTNGLIWKYSRCFRFELLSDNRNQVGGLGIFKNRRVLGDLLPLTMLNSFHVVKLISLMQNNIVLTKYNRNNQYRAVLDNDVILKVPNVDTYEKIKVGESLAFDALNNTYDLVSEGGKISMFSITDLPPQGLYPDKLDLREERPEFTGTRFLFDFYGFSGKEIDKIFQILYQILNLQEEGPEKSLLTLLTELYTHLEDICLYGESCSPEVWGIFET